MCASYGLDPRFATDEMQDFADQSLLDGLRDWAAQNDSDVLRPTGIRARNLNPIITARDRWENGWWGFLEGGAPVKYPSINTRSERLARGKGPLPRRGIVPVTYWRERHSATKTWYHFGQDGELFGLAAVLRRGWTPEGNEVTCYSIVMRDAAGSVTPVHDRMPVLIGSRFAEEWLESTEPAAAVVDAALATSDDLVSQIVATPQQDPDALF